MSLSLNGGPVYGKNHVVHASIAGARACHIIDAIDVSSMFCGLEEELFIPYNLVSRVLENQ